MSVPLGVYDLSVSLLILPVCTHIVYVHACAWPLGRPLPLAGMGVCPSLRWAPPLSLHTPVSLDGLIKGRCV